VNSVLSEILNTGATQTADGKGTVKVHSAVSVAEGHLLQKLVRQVDPTMSLEVGFAYGVSALFICDALNVRKGTQHIAIDPNQYRGQWGDSWEGIGIANLHRAGYGDIVRLIESPSYRALAELERSGQHLDFAFICGLERVMAGGRPPSFYSFTCPNCQALYHIVKVEAGPETNDRELACRSCGAPLPSREGSLVLKYFLLRKAGPTRRRA